MLTADLCRYVSPIFMHLLLIGIKHQPNVTNCSTLEELYVVILRCTKFLTCYICKQSTTVTEHFSVPRDLCG